jgi:DNA-directed RNA polymerase subunit RPC12/RpoP
MPNWGGASDKCKVCGKTVYEMEKLQMEANVFHKTCFKCAKCGKVLRTGDYTAIHGEIFCKPHYKQLFAVKGNYEEGFKEALADAQKAQQNQDKKAADKKQAASAPAEVAEAEAEAEADAE